MLEALLQILVNSLIGNLTEQCEVRDTNFLLLRALKNGLPDLRSPVGAGFIVPRTSKTAALLFFLISERAF